MAKSRNYKDEYRKFQGSPQQIKDRAARNKARAEAVKDGRIEKGSPKEIDHVKPLAKGGSTAKSNTRVTTRHANRVKGKKTPKKG